MNVHVALCMLRRFLRFSVPICAAAATLHGQVLAPADQKAPTNEVKVKQILPVSMSYRSSPARERAMAFFKMKPASEAAVVKGLEWLAKSQNADGSWGESYRGSMTGFALLCFLGHGETGESQKYGVHVAKAAKWILENGEKYAGRLNMEEAFTQTGVYEHGICALALGDYYTMTSDERVIDLYKKAIGYVVTGQSTSGSWTYGFTKDRSDLNVSSWQIQALKMAQGTGLRLPGADAAIGNACGFVERFMGPRGGYGYTGPEDRMSLSGIGILTRIWGDTKHSKLKKGMDWLLDAVGKERPVKYHSEYADLYAWYYHTQAALWFGSTAWAKWNRWFQDEIALAQSTDGSWPPPGGKSHGPTNENSMTGKVFRSSLCILMLESFYRYVPPFETTPRK